MLTSSANTEAVPAISEAALNERITAIVPARDEEATIEICVRSLAKQGKITEIFVVNDGSTDRTAEIVRGLMVELKNLTLLEAAQIPVGWLGKNHALWEGAKRATSHISDRAESDRAELGRSNAAPLPEGQIGCWLLFTDADAELLDGAAARGTADCEGDWGGAGVVLAGAGYQSVVREGVDSVCVFEVGETLFLRGGEGREFKCGRGEWAILDDAQ